MEGVTLTNASAPDRSGTDFYPTPPEATRALADYLGLGGYTIWEPACGAGHMARELERCGATVIASDLYDQGFGEAGVDFLFAPTPVGIDWIITNPPFRMSAEFICSGVARSLPFALLLKSQYWHSARRRALFESHRPLAVLPLTWRPDFHFGAKGGAPTMEVAWTVWGSQPAAETIYHPLKRPQQ